MESTIIIYPMFLTDNEFYKLTLVKDSLTELEKSIIDISCDHSRLQGIRLVNCILDLGEIIKYRNIKGYKWNSYILSMIIIKLTYISKVIKDCKIVEAYQIAECSENNLLILTHIFESNYSLYLINLY
jgi:hypothetical protein